MFKRGVLVIPVDVSLDDIHIILENASNYVRSELFIQFLYETHFQLIFLPKLSTIATRIYEESIKVFSDEFDLRVQISNFRESHVLPIMSEVEVLLFGMEKVPQELRDRYRKRYECENVMNVGEDVRREKSLEHLGTEKEDMYETVVLGGTFDRLHVGHKILLTESVIRARKRVVVGVTDENMVRKGKILPELILPVNYRIRDVEKFLKTIDETLEYEVVPISDPFGPTATDPDMDMIVVSEETARGGQKVNELRTSKGLKTLKIHAIPLVDYYELDTNTSNTEIDEQKVSSSRKRYELLGKYLKLERKTDRISKEIYVIGLIDTENHDLESFLGTKGASIFKFQPNTSQNQELVENIKKFSREQNKNLIFLVLGITIESEIDRYCQEVWTCLSPQKFLDEKLLEISEVFFSTSLSLVPQVTKAWNALSNRMKSEL